MCVEREFAYSYIVSEKQVFDMEYVDILEKSMLGELKQEYEILYTLPVL
jgi:hypothetical protein